MLLSLWPVLALFLCRRPIKTVPIGKSSTDSIEHLAPEESFSFCIWVKIIYRDSTA